MRRRSDRSGGAPLGAPHPLACDKSLRASVERFTLHAAPPVPDDPVGREAPLGPKV